MYRIMKLEHVKLAKLRKPLSPFSFLLTNGQIAKGMVGTLL